MLNPADVMPLARTLAPCVNSCCFAPGTSLETFVTEAARAGFARVEVPIQQVILLGRGRGGVDATARCLAAAGVTVEQFSGLLPDDDVLPAPLLVEEDRWVRLAGTVDERLAAAEAIGCHRASIVCDPWVDTSRGAARATALQRLTRLAERASWYGIALSVEFIGVRSGVDGGRVQFVTRLDELVDLLAELDAPNVGLLLDTCHLYASGATPDDVLALEQGAIAFLHVSDVPPEIPPAAMEDSMRCAVGDGVLETATYVVAASRRGYDGPLSIELFSSDVWELSPRKAATLLFRSALTLAEDVRRGISPAVGDDG